MTRIGVLFLLCASAACGTPYATPPSPVARNLAAPTQRNGHRMAYDETRAVTVLFGGLLAPSSEPTAETWVWNGVAWQLVATSGPAPRSWHSLVFDRNRRVVVLFGGR